MQLTYLQLCQRAARDSGTVSGTRPTTVETLTQLTLREQKIVAYVAEAWELIQNLNNNLWLWMLKEFSASIISGTARYSATDLLITDWQQWILPDRNGENSLTIYETATGVSDEGPLAFIDFATYLRRYERGSQTASRPSEYSIAPNGNLCFGPEPDTTYTAKGRYKKTNQVLALNADIPEMPAAFHMAIKHQALMLLAEHDEVAFPIQVESRKLKQFLDALISDQLVGGGIGQMLAHSAGPLA
jgi:hypothetical protein